MHEPDHVRRRSLHPSPVSFSRPSPTPANPTSVTGDHSENTHHEPQWIPFPTCAETDRSLEFYYGVEGPQNCTLSSVSDDLFRLLALHSHHDAPLTCRLPARPRPQHDILNDAPHAQEHVPLVFALATGEEEDGRVRVANKMNVLLHTAPKRKVRAHDTGVLDSGVAYSTSPLSESQSVSVGDPLKLQFSVRWFPSPDLPSTDGAVRWAGMGGPVHVSTVVYISLSFITGAVAAGAWFYGRVLPRRLKGRGLGGAIPLGGVSVGTGWGYAKRAD